LSYQKFFIILFIIDNASGAKLLYLGKTSSPPLYTNISDRFSIPSAGMYIPWHGTYVPQAGTAVPSNGTEFT